MIVAEKITQTFNGLAPFHVAGEYFKLLEASAAVDVELWKDGRRVLRALQVEAGFYQRVPFDLIKITTGSSMQVSFLIAGDEGGSDRFTGTFTAQGTLGTLAQVAIGGVNALQVTDRGYAPGADFRSVAALAALTAETVFAPAANTNGAIVWSADMWSQDAGASFPTLAIVAHTAAPVDLSTGTHLARGGPIAYVTGALTEGRVYLDRPRFIAAGLGLYFIVSRAENSGIRGAAYTLL